jgi:hypothetical protein
MYREDLSFAMMSTYQCHDELLRRYTSSGLEEIGISLLDCYGWQYEANDKDKIIKGVFTISKCTGTTTLYLGNYLNNFTIHDTLMNINRILSSENIFFDSIDCVRPVPQYQIVLSDYQKNLIKMYNECYPICFKKLLKPGKIMRDCE